MLRALKHRQPCLRPGGIQPGYAIRRRGGINHLVIRCRKGPDGQLRQCFLIPPGECDAAAHGHDAGEVLRRERGQRPCAGAAHAVPGQDDAARIDGIPGTDSVDQCKDLIGYIPPSALFLRALGTQNISAQIAQPSCLYILRKSVRIGDPLQIAPFSAAAMQIDDQRKLLLPFACGRTANSPALMTQERQDRPSCCRRLRLLLAAQPPQRRFRRVLGPLSFCLA